MPILTQAVVTLLIEAYSGPPNPKQTWFIDNEPNCGILGVLDGVTAAEASRSVDGSGRAGTSIAANVEHLRWSLGNANSQLRGVEYQGSWHESWHLKEADEAAWQQLRQQLRAEFEALCVTIQAQTDLPGEYLTGVLALLPHAAYHLGNIRQMVERLRAP